MHCELTWIVLLINNYNKYGEIYKYTFNKIIRFVKFSKIIRTNIINTQFILNSYEILKTSSSPIILIFYRALAHHNEYSMARVLTADINCLELKSHTNIC